MRPGRGAAVCTAGREKRPPSQRRNFGLRAGGHRGAGWVVLLGGRSSQAADMSLISAGAVHRVTNEREKQVMRTVGSEERVGSDLRLLRRGRGGFAVRMV